MTAVAVQRPTSYRFDLSCPACGEPMRLINTAHPSSREAKAILACCGQDWIVTVDLVPFGRGARALGAR